MQRTALAALVALPLAAIPFATGMTPALDGVELGEKVEYTFRSPVLGAMGASSMSEFLGKPVLIDFWGTR